jgi:hypothetical protein
MQRLPESGLAGRRSNLHGVSFRNPRCYRIEHPPMTERAGGRRGVLVYAAAAIVGSSAVAAVLRALQLSVEDSRAAPVLSARGRRDL